MQNPAQNTQEKDADDIIDVSKIDVDDEHWLKRSEIITVKGAEKKMLDLSGDIHTENIDPNSTINKSHTLLNFTCRKSNQKSNNSFEKLADQTFEKKFKTQPQKLDTFEKSDLNEIFLKTTDNVSNSIRGSTQMMMAEVDAIVKIQENSLPAMSTPEPGTTLTKFFENTSLSPIPNLNIKEPDKPALERNVQNLSNLKNPNEYHNPRSANTITRNLKTTNIPTFKGLYSNPKIVNSKLRSSSSNVKSVNSNLTGSYTNLKPVNKNLPHITSKPIVPNANIDLKITNALEGPGRQDVFKMPLPLKESNPSAIKISRLPRPIGSATGIPRPTSKIPVPKQIRSSFARELVPIGSATGIPRPTSKIPVPKQIRSSSARELVRPNSKKFK